MDYIGVIIEESLKNKRILQSVIITDTRVEQVTPAHQTPWLKQWTLHTITVPVDTAGTVARQLSDALEDNYWYVDYRNRATHYIIFPGKIFQVDRSQPQQYEAAKAYGMDLGIPEHQLTFSAEVAEP
jgi:hypothetical protein